MSLRIFKLSIIGIMVCLECPIGMLKICSNRVVRGLVHTFTPPKKRSDVIYQPWQSTGTLFPMSRWGLAPERFILLIISGLWLVTN